jgi:hypothetical protein
MTTLFDVPARQACGIVSLESITGLLKRLKIRALGGGAEEGVYRLLHIAVTSTTEYI